MMSRLLAAFAGTLLPSLLHAVLSFGWEVPEPLIRERFFVVFAGDLILAGLAGLWIWRRGSPPGAAALAGLFTGLAGWTGHPLAGLFLALTGIATASRLHDRFRFDEKGLCRMGWVALAIPVLALFLDGPRGPLDWEAPPQIGAQASAQGWSAAPPQAPSVLLIVADTLRADAILDPEVATPHLDRLRARGMWFASAITPSNQTLPSHLSLFTGLSAEKIGMRSNYSSWPTTELLRTRWGMRTLAERFGEAGWQTHAVVGNPMLSLIPENAMEVSTGFASWDPLTRVETWPLLLDWKSEWTWLGWMGRGILEIPVNQALRRLLYPHPRRLQRFHDQEGPRTTARAVAAVRELSETSRPWFLFVNYMEVHAPYQPVGSEVSPEEEFSLRKDLRDLASGRSSNSESAAVLRRLYLREVEQLDQEIGQLLAAATTSNRPLLVAVVGDHGEMLGEYGLIEHGASLHAEQLEVPFLLAGPGVAEGVELAGSVEILEAAHTLLALAGLSTIGLDGRNLVEEADQLRPIFSVMPQACSLQMGRWKAVFRIIADSKLELQSLWDTQSSEGEEKNCLPEEPDLALEMQRLAQEFLARDVFPDLEPRVLNLREQNLLDQLGYAHEDP